jgi:DNA-binding CsgD family transcriptional regulator
MSDLTGQTTNLKSCFIRRFSRQCAKVDPGDLARWPACRQEGLVAVKRTIIPPDIDAYREQLASLTPRERECLLLVDQGYSSKAIAGFLAITPGRVDKYIGSGRKRLGALLRRDAARLVAAYETEIIARGGAGQLLGAQFLSLYQPGDTPSDGPANHGAEAQDAMAGRLAEEQELYVLSGNTLTLCDLMPLRKGRRTANELSSSKTLIACAVLSAAALVAAGSSVSLLLALDQLFQR